ncbi:MAG: adenosylcobinamide amidohydrolase [Kineosporiaceae bacterium]
MSLPAPVGLTEELREAARAHAAGTGRFRLRAYYDGHHNNAPDPRRADVAVSLDAVVRPALVWVGGDGWRMIGTGVLGGGIGPRRWWVNAMVDKEYHHPDPRRHVAEIAADLGLTGPGTGMLTAAEVGSWRYAHEDGVHVATTVGLGWPVWAAQAPGADDAPSVGTVNTLVEVPVAMSDAALVNLVVTATEAKVQALAECGVPGTGTSSDALAVACPAPDAARRRVEERSPEADGRGRPAEEPYGGPRSRWGAVVARVVHAATVEGVRDWMQRHPDQAAAWSRS